MLSKNINALVLGATGFVGLDLVFLLSKHPKVKIQYLCASKNIGKKINYFDKRIKKKLPKISKFEKADLNNIDVIFLSMPNGFAQSIVKKCVNYKNLKFIDLSADFRLTSPSMYKKWYKKNHIAKELIKKSIYSIPEFNRSKIKNFNVIGNPGCYPTSIQLALNPLIKKKLIKLNNIIIDSKSGYSGAGKNLKKRFTHKNLYKSIFAYNVNGHRHMAELDQEFKKLTKRKIIYTFNTHLIPTFRGLLSSMHIEVSKHSNCKKILNELINFHKKNYFVKILKANKEIGTNNVINTNNCEISVCQSRHKKKLIIFSAIDNLVKGASGQAIQNMNILFNLKENLGLK